jgi:hypothetical protein
VRKSSKQPVLISSSRTSSLLTGAYPRTSGARNLLNHGQRWPAQCMSLSMLNLQTLTSIHMYIFVNFSVHVPVISPDLRRLLRRAARSSPLSPQSTCRVFQGSCSSSCSLVGNPSMVTQYWTLDGRSFAEWLRRGNAHHSTYHITNAHHRFCSLTRDKLANSHSALYNYTTRASYFPAVGDWV